ncbi:MAG: hypothetical protein RLZZ502_1248 [Pseudomonadota bacterium]
MGNLASVAKALSHLAPQHHVCITSKPEVVIAAERVVLPGQSAMPETMRAFHASGLYEATCAARLNKPFFGVCLGMQMLLDHSEEGDTKALGFIAGKVKKLQPSQQYKVPHMGWNQVRHFDHPMFNGIAQKEFFYFAHSYCAVPDQPSVTAATTSYPDEIAVALAADNLFAVQFHPEKSAQAGLRLLSNFLHWNP